MDATHRPAHHKDIDFDQMVIAKEMFDWWEKVGVPPFPNRPDWNECNDYIQSFWMDGAWRVMKKMDQIRGTTLIGRVHR